MKKRTVRKSLAREYVSHWYVVLLTILFCFPAYMLLPLAISFISAKGVSDFWAGIAGIAISGFVATFPILILNLRLAARRKFYALAVQFVLFDGLGTAFYLVNRVMMNK